MYSKLYYDKQNKKFYVKELNTEKNGGILVVTDEQYVDVTDEIVELFQERARDGKQVLCFDTTTPQLQKPWEWSEEETKVLDSIIDDYEKASKSFCGYDGKIGLLRAIRDGEYGLSKQEWSEEDRDMHTRCCSILGKCAIGELPLSVIEECAWLKSLPERFNLQSRQEWSEEDEKLFWGFTAWVPNEELERLGVTRDDILKKLKSLRSQPIQLKEAYKEGFQTARHATALAFMKYCDKIRPNGKMCLSNGECEEIEKAFLVGDWEKIERYFHKYS